jgi:hypothetical protein
VLTGRGADYLIPDGQCQVESNQPGGQSNYSDLVCGASDRFTPTLRCFQGPLAFDVYGAVGAKTEVAGATSDSEEVMLWYENVVKPVARAAGARVQV